MIQRGSCSHERPARGRPCHGRTPAWLAEMASWVDARLAARGHPPTQRACPDLAAAAGRPAQLETDRGRMWAKAVPPVFAHEVALTELLADIDPGIVPPVVAADRALGRIITEHVGRPAALGARRRPADLGRDDVAAGRDPACARQRTDGAAGAGAVAAPMARLAEALPTLLGDDDLLLVIGPDGLTGREAAALRRRIPALVDACRRARGQRHPGQPRPRRPGRGRGHHRRDGSGLPRLVRRVDHASVPVGGGVAARAAARTRPADELAAAYLGPWLSAGLGLTEEAGRTRSRRLGRSCRSIASRCMPSGSCRPSMIRPSLASGHPRALRAILPG